MSDSHVEFRRFALAVYEQDGVAAAALQLQDARDVDVNVVLLAAYLGAVRGSVFDVDDVAAVQARVAAWQRDVVRPLRAVRRGLKTGPPPAPDAATEALRQRVKALELDAELIELDELSALADRSDYAAAPGTALQRARAAITAVVGDDDDAVAVIASAAARYEESA